jgi:hypothetical protein
MRTPAGMRGRGGVFALARGSGVRTKLWGGLSCDERTRNKGSEEVSKKGRGEGKGRPSQLLTSKGGCRSRNERYQRGTASKS